MIDCDQLLYGECTWAEVADYFKKGSFDDESYLVIAIKKHLRTPEHKNQIDINDLSVEDMLNGRFGSQKEKIVLAIFDHWNKSLGFKCFGY